MIAKISNWSSGRELIRYLFGPGKVHAHIDGRVLTSGIVMGVDEGRALSTGELAGMERHSMPTRTAGGPVLPADTFGTSRSRSLSAIVN